MQSIGISHRGLVVQHSGQQATRIPFGERNHPSFSWTSLSPSGLPILVLLPGLHCQVPVLQVEVLSAYYQAIGVLLVWSSTDARTERSEWVSADGGHSVKREGNQPSHERTF
jgi:hypothetical protein